MLEELRQITSTCESPRRTGVKETAQRSQYVTSFFTQVWRCASTVYYVPTL